MGLFKIFKDYKREDCEDILKTAKAISGNDVEVVKQMEFALKEPVKYIKQYADRFDERSIEIDSGDISDEMDSDELLLLAMVDELEEHGYEFELDWKCELEDFLWGLEQIKGYALIKDVIQTLDLSEDDDVEEWGKQINAALGGKAYIGYIDIDSDSYPVVIVASDELEKITLPFIIAL